ncbi:hypothetical protein [Achromobacter ruhlandii]|nr:hypothetical protein [Achromobacter ruhlandii]AOU92990.1 uncharacterized protein AruCF_2099 [Achromobacter ruhlandii]MCZ8432501.1 hypothetical protein [Achromobacter ruhlandii]MDC6089554.1 hypothetical protein [Achromobacter ruhlandii]MDC6148841.1 hypothetical protein [Achromobacter ruhlandii]MDD7978050.1 hypothetical protein [Achromobacter ruhlandii]
MTDGNMVGSTGADCAASAAGSRLNAAARLARRDMAGSNIDMAPLDEF